MRRQSIANQHGEVLFRKKLSEQQVVGTEIFGDEAHRGEIEPILRARMREMQAAMTVLRARGESLSPYVEIGAERGQRCLVLENDFGAHGAAIDLSFHMLQSCDYYAAVFERDVLPLRVCCDVYTLPFFSGSLPFVFCYATLHHFPDPTPVIREAYRVLSPGGIFLFGEEPYRKSLRLPLYIRERHDTSKHKIKRLIDYFFSRRTGNEERHGIVENHDIPPRVWREAFSPFESKEILLRSWLKEVEAPLFAPRNRIASVCSRLIGGKVEGLARKSGTSDGGRPRAIEELLACPSCIARGREIGLVRDDRIYTCPECNERYPIVDNVLLLLPAPQLSDLYPEYAHGMSPPVR